MSSNATETSKGSFQAGDTRPLNAQATTWQQQAMMNSNDMQPSSGSNVERQRARQPRQSPVTRHRQPRPATNTTHDSQTQRLPGPSQSLSARSNGNGRPNGVFPEGQGQTSKPASGPRPNRRPQAVEDAMRNLTVSHRGNRPPRRLPQNNGFARQDLDQHFVPPSPNASTNSQQTTGLPQDRSEASTSVSSFGPSHGTQSPHSFQQFPVRAQNGDGQHGRHANGMQLFGQQHLPGLVQQRRPRQGPPSSMQQPPHSMHPAGVRHQSQQPPPPPFPLQQRQAHNLPPVDQIRRTSQMQPRRMPPDSRRLRGARPGPPLQNGGEKSHGKTEGDAAASEEAEDVPSCVICTGPQSIVAVGTCNHKEMCARCSLLMRLNYDDTACPFCKTELPQVILTRWKPDGVPDYSILQSRSKTMWRKPAWARGVLVDDQSSSGHPLLNSIVQGITAMACPVCDEGGARPFRSTKLLQAHVKAEHGRSMCDTCLMAKRRFPLELDTYSKEDLAVHMGEHPRCDFCEVHMYSGDELYEHMRQQHFTCDICQRRGAFMHFDSADALMRHLRSDHHLCEEGECAGCLIAFGSAEELAQHRRERHSRTMPRFDRSRARVLPLGADAFPSRPGPPGARPLPTSPDRDRAPEVPSGRSQRGAHSGGRASSRNGTAGSAQSSGRGREPVHTRSAEESSPSGMVMIDDDLGMTEEAFPHMGSASSSRPGSEPRRHVQAEQPSEDFPSLQAAVQPAGPASTSAAQPRAPALPSLQKVTVKCPCGRKVSHIALPQGTTPKPIRCDAECERVKRSSRLADAFGIEDPGHHVPWVNRHRDVHYTPELLLYAWHNRSAVEALERQLADFVADAGKKRASLAPAPKQARHIQHVLADQYGLASQSFGAEPNRHVQLFKAAHAALPRVSLAKAAAASTLDDLERAVRAEKGYPVHFADVSPAADLHRILDRWEGQFVLSGPHPDGSAVARFSRPEAAKQVLDALGGGVRGQYRINRAASSAAAAPASMPQSHVGSGSTAPPRPAAIHQSALPKSSTTAGITAGSHRTLPRAAGAPVSRAAMDPGAIRASDMAFEEAPLAAKAVKRTEVRAPTGLQPSLEHMPKQGLNQQPANGAAEAVRVSESADEHVAESWEDAADEGQ
ncbi:probable E3 ubiquitin-protein ligase ZNF598 at N-terminal half [Coccomyxa sp. Obi]|nr:probable E3 ubiquitin-protein ligase ZNF598 at N-terminal half [Coccomyxa sp. Obi]